MLGLAVGLVGAASGVLVDAVSAEDPASGKVHVLVWDEQQPVSPRVYPGFPGEWIAAELEKDPALEVRSASIHDPGLGLAAEALEWADVLVFWGHVRHHEIPEETGARIVGRIRAGELAMITLHSAHWSVPFMMAMEAKAADDALALVPVGERDRAEVRFLGERERRVPPSDRRPVLAAELLRRDDGSITIALERPNCVFPRCCTPVQPSTIRIIEKAHPIAAGVPERFVIPATEMYDEPFHVPAPDLVVFDESWEGGEHFRSGALWKVGRGMVFYFRPGDQQYPVYRESPVLRILANASRWLGRNLRDAEVNPSRE